MVHLQLTWSARFPMWPLLNEKDWMKKMHFWEQTRSNFDFLAEPALIIVSSYWSFLRYHRPTCLHPLFQFSAINRKIVKVGFCPNWQLAIVGTKFQLLQIIFLFAPYFTQLMQLAQTTNTRTNTTTKNNQRSAKNYNKSTQLNQLCSHFEPYPCP